MMSKEKTLDFTPFSQADVNVLLAAVPVVDEKIKAYKVKTWFDRANMRILWGICCKVDGSWANMCEGEKALIFEDEKTANAVCRHFKKGLVPVVA